MKELKKLDRYEVKVKLTGGSTQNFCNDDGSYCNVGDIIKFCPRAHSRENAIKAVKHTLNFCHCKYEIL